MSASIINDPQHWRDRAKEARAIADEMNDRDAKQMMLGIARSYILLAERAEARAMAFGAKRTWMGVWIYPPGSWMSQTGLRGD